MFPQRESKVVSPTSRALNFGWAPCKAREVWAGAVAKHSLRPRALVAARQGQRRDAVKNQGQHRDAAATGRERLGRCKATELIYIQLSRCKGKLAPAMISLRRVRVVGEGIAAGAPPLTHICTVGACGKRPRRGPPAALPRKACDGMLGAIVRIAQPQVVGASFFVKHIISYS